MNISELYSALNKKIPQDLSCEWDNDGVMCSPDKHRDVRRVLVALDVTGKTVDTAIAGNYDLIVSHHPFIFKGIKSINEENFICDKAIQLIKNGISVFSFHTRLDALKGGVNDTLASLLGITDTEPLGEDGMGRIGYLGEESELYAFAKFVKDRLNCDGVTFADGGRSCKRIAVLGGGGGDYVDAAIAAGADTFVSGELKYHSLSDAPDMGINLIAAGHFHTENPVCEVLKKMITEQDENIVCDIFDSNVTKII